MRRINLWFWLAILGGLLLCKPVWAVSNMQVTVVNHSGYPDNQVYISFKLQPGNDKTNWYHISNWQNIAIKIFSDEDNTNEVPPKSGKFYANYSTTLDQLNKNADGRRYFEMPPCLDATLVPKGVETGRLWISFEKPVYFQIKSSTAFTQPDPTNQSDVNNQTVWDFFEANASYTEIKGQFQNTIHYRPCEHYQCRLRRHAPGVRIVQRHYPDSRTGWAKPPQNAAL